ncbi:HAMP domain-containing histidine kinase [Methylicorpusculum oleiharenae]|uniref:sensor histidine kinase n=1 Tax=Methylicorpusculum oleiharenae TaxID=1338687 RepID=UPI001359D286|nr:HAMP domain-containing sensor histidine kinase [Methylicorpusculum oleiharenae]MCD2452921.1 HAMP domain-containing histidine kinase [Methylicorpusculum oleiharenae]
MACTLNLRQRFSLTVLLAITLASTIMILTIYWAVSTYTREYTLHYWQSFAQTFANSAKFSVTLASPDKASEIARHFKKERAIELAGIYSSNGERLATTGEANPCTGIAANEPVTQGRFTSDFKIELSNTWCLYAPIYYKPAAADYLEAEQSATHAHAFIGFVELAVSKQPLNRMIDRILWLSVLSVIVFELVIFVSVRHLSDTLTRALLELARVMKQTSLGKRGIRATFEGPSDIEALKHRLNQMLDQIEAQEEELELKVATRTSALQLALEGALSASRYKSNIMSMVSHEMKSPLHAVMGYTQLALEATEASADPALKQFLTKGLNNAKNLEHQINQILDYARLEAGKAQLQMTRFALRHVIHQCVDRIEPLTEHTGNRIRINGAPLEIETDQDKLMHILMNLIGNANKFTRDGFIDIAWSMQPGHLLITVSDTGCGIAASDQAKIFEPFWQADMSLSRPVGGTGLGLAICKLYTDLLSGKLSVESSTQGSVFTLVLPIVTA